jgi:S-adenosylmethionine decarboxylase
LECKHCILELYKADPIKLNDEGFVRAALVNAADIANSTLLSVKTHVFEPQGVTAFALLAESHISFHSWPELNYAAIDAFTCGEQTDPEAACRFLMMVFDAPGSHLSVIQRTVPLTLNTD